MIRNLDQQDLKVITKVLENSKIFGGNKVIAKKDNVILCRPTHTWGTNFHLYDLKEEIEYLIDMEDVSVDEEECEEEGLLNYEDLISLFDPEYIKEYSWTTKPMK